LLEAHPRLAGALGRALQRAREYCAAPANREALWRRVLAQHPYASLGEEDRAALSGGEGATMRFDGRGHLAPGDDVAFLEAACRGAIGPSARSLDLRAEIARVFAPCAATAVEPVVGKL
jgi:NitT/TauT family transport system ATP-binding protein/bicarbonate transport system ATP-binding protein